MRPPSARTSSWAGTFQFCARREDEGLGVADSDHWFRSARSDIRGRNPSRKRTRRWFRRRESPGWAGMYQPFMTSRRKPFLVRSSRSSRVRLLRSDGVPTLRLQIFRAPRRPSETLLGRGHVVASSCKFRRPSPPQDFFAFRVVSRIRFLRLSNYRFLMLDRLSLFRDAPDFAFPSRIRTSERPCPATITVAGPATIMVAGSAPARASRREGRSPDQRLALAGADFLIAPCPGGGQPSDGVEGGRAPRISFLTDASAMPGLHLTDPQARLT